MHLSSMAKVSIKEKLIHSSFTFKRNSQYMVKLSLNPFIHNDTLSHYYCQELWAQ
jgi:hypothetical protein